MEVGEGSIVDGGTSFKVELVGERSNEVAARRVELEIDGVGERDWDRDGRRLDLAERSERESSRDARLGDGRE